MEYIQRPLGNALWVGRTFCKFMLNSSFHWTETTSFGGAGGGTIWVVHTLGSFDKYVHAHACGGHESTPGIFFHHCLFYFILFFNKGVFTDSEAYHLTCQFLQRTKTICPSSRDQACWVIA